MQIAHANGEDYQTLIDLWEASVRATHHFLPEAEILALRPLILEHYFDAVTLYCARTEEGHIAGFSGVLERKLANPKLAEMIKKLSRLKYGKDKNILEVEIAKRARL